MYIRRELKLITVKEMSKQSLLDIEHVEIDEGLHKKRLEIVRGPTFFPKTMWIYVRTNLHRRYLFFAFASLNDYIELKGVFSCCI